MFSLVKNGSETIAQLPGCGGKFRANADLISAAPELLECLKEAVLEFGCHTHMLAITHGECNGFIREEWRCTLPEGKCFAQRWLAAIRKAERIQLSPKEKAIQDEIDRKVKEEESR